jgi:membrane protein DedA with SNARE-associated domain/rhodanese-related sulfurtransferase
MKELLAAMAHHGYMWTFAVLFMESVGVPLPAAIALVAGGAGVASHTLSPPALLFTAVGALLLGDIIQFWLGRSAGWALLGFLCRLSLNPETCILRAAESFYKRGKATLLIAKFIPGLNTMAAPLAGSMKMPFWQFLRLDIAGALFYSSTYMAVGYVSRDFLAAVLNGFHAAGQVMEVLLITAVVAYAVYRALQFRKYQDYKLVPRIQAQQLAERLASEGRGKVLIVDVRSHGYYDAGAERILGSIRIEPNNLDEEVKLLPRDKDIYLYCTCVREATSAQVAHLLRERGFSTFVIVGGLTAWRKAGEPLESVPKDDLVKLPTFS